MNPTIYINDEAIKTDFFQNFNWYNFEPNEAVFLDDCDETDFLIARFWRIEDGEDGRKIILKAINRKANLKSSYRKSTV